MLGVSLPRPKHNGASARLVLSFTIFFPLWESISVFLAHNYIFSHGQYLAWNLFWQQSHFLRCMIKETSLSFLLEKLKCNLLVSNELEGKIVSLQRNLQFYKKNEQVNDQKRWSGKEYEYFFICKCHLDRIDLLCWNIFSARVNHPETRLVFGLPWTISLSLSLIWIIFIQVKAF